MVEDDEVSLQLIGDALKLRKIAFIPALGISEGITLLESQEVGILAVDGLFGDWYPVVVAARKAQIPNNKIILYTGEGRFLDEGEEEGIIALSKKGNVIKFFNLLRSLSTTTT